MARRKQRMLFIRWGIGILLSLLFILLALRRVDPVRMMDMIADVRKLPLLLSFCFLCAGDFLRALRWKILLLPLKKSRTGECFSLLMISYAVNALLPIRLGELVRAVLLGRKHRIPSGSVFATVVLERLLDFGMIAVFVVVVWICTPLPLWLKRVSIILFVFLISLCILLFIAKKNIPRAEKGFERVLKSIPAAPVRRIRSLVCSFLRGFARPVKPAHDVLIVLLSMAIWICNWISMRFGMYAMDLRLPWYAPLLLVVFVSLSFAVPSSPGYLGTFHWVCQAGLGLFKVNATTAVAFAAVLHLLNVLPYLAAGLVCAWIEGVNVIHLQEYVAAEEDGSCA